MNPMTTLDCGNVQEGGAIPPSISNIVQFPGNTSTSISNGGKTLNIERIFQNNWLIVILLIIIFALSRGSK
jgi:hypothetical protein